MHPIQQMRLFLGLVALVAILGGVSSPTSAAASELETRRHHHRPRGRGSAVPNEIEEGDQGCAAWQWSVRHGVSLIKPIPGMWS